MTDTSATSTVSTVSTTWLNWLVGLGSTVAFSIASPIISALIEFGASPTAILIMRFIITTLLLGGHLALITPARLRIDRRGLFIVGIAGLATGVSTLLFTWSLTRLDTSVASMIYSLYPLVVLGLLALRGEKFTYRNVIRLILGIGGIYLLIGPGGQVDLIGVGMIALSLIAASLQTVFMQWFLQGYDGRTITFYMVAAMTLVVAVWWPVEGGNWHLPGWQSWLGIAVLAVVSTYLARLAMFNAVRSLGGGQVAMLVPLETLLTIIWSVIFLQERLTSVQWVGGLLILLSALLAMQRLGRARWRPRWRALPRP